MEKSIFLEKILFWVKLSIFRNKKSFFFGKKNHLIFFFHFSHFYFSGKTHFKRLCAMEATGAGPADPSDGVGPPRMLLDDGIPTPPFCAKDFAAVLTVDLDEEGDEAADEEEAKEEADEEEAEEEPGYEPVWEDDEDDDDFLKSHKRSKAAKSHLGKAPKRRRRVGSKDAARRKQTGRSKEAEEQKRKERSELLEKQYFQKCYDQLKEGTDVVEENTRKAANMFASIEELVDKTRPLANLISLACSQDALPGIAVRFKTPPTRRGKTAIKTSAQLGMEVYQYPRESVTQQLKLLGKTMADIEEQQKKLKMLISDIKTTRLNLSSEMTRAISKLNLAQERMKTQMEILDEKAERLRSSQAMFPVADGSIILNVLPDEMVRLIFLWLGPNSSVSAVCKAFRFHYRAVVPQLQKLRLLCKPMLMRFNYLPDDGFTPRGDGIITHDGDLEVKGGCVYVGSKCVYLETEHAARHTALITPLYIAVGTSSYIFIFSRKEVCDMAEVPQSDRDMVKPVRRIYLYGDLVTFSMCLVNPEFMHRIFWVDSRRIVQCRDITTDKPLWEYDAHSIITHLSINEQNGTALLSALNDTNIPGTTTSNGHAQLFDIRTGTNIKRFPFPINHVHRIKSIVSIGSGPKKMVFFAIFANKTLKMLDAHEPDPVFKCVDVLPDFDVNGKRTLTCRRKYPGGLAKMHARHDRIKFMFVCHKRIFVAYTEWENQHFGELTWDTAIKSVA